MLPGSAMVSTDLEGDHNHSYTMTNVTLSVLAAARTVLLKGLMDFRVTNLRLRGFKFIVQRGSLRGWGEPPVERSIGIPLVYGSTV